MRAALRHAAAPSRCRARAPSPRGRRARARRAQRRRCIRSHRSGRSASRAYIIVHLSRGSRHAPRFLPGPRRRARRVPGVRRRVQEPDVHVRRRLPAGARGFAARLHEAGLRKGDTVVFWSENRPEWIAAFWGCLLAGVVVVPIDYRVVSGLPRGASAASSRPSSCSSARTCRRCARSRRRRRAGLALHELDWTSGEPPPLPAVAVVRDDVAEIIFTSGATAEPKGVVITHRNVLANIVPVEREVLKYRKWGAAVLPDPVPQPAAAQPHVRPGDGDVHPADAARHGRLHARLQPGRHRRAGQDAADVGARVRAEDPRRAARARPADRARRRRHRARSGTGSDAGGGTAASIGCSA